MSVCVSHSALSCLSVCLVRHLFVGLCTWDGAHFFLYMLVFSVPRSSLQGVVTMFECTL